MLKMNLFKLNSEKCNHERDSTNRNKNKDESDKTNNKIMDIKAPPE